MEVESLCSDVESRCLYSGELSFSDDLQLMSAG